MAALPVLAIGMDPGWRARMQRLLAGRTELRWLGAHAPARDHPAGAEPPALLLLDGDDPLTDRARRRPLLPAPWRLYFYRQPSVAALVHCIEAGAHGCLDKQAAPATVLQALRAIQAGLFVATPDLLLRAVGVQAAAPVEAPRGDWSLLTGRQREIVACAARGLSNKQIARALGISPETVKTHLQRVFERHGVHGRIALLSGRDGNGATPR
ncbi:MAG TPA: response regulator transcription factor [Xanthomonadaceae bacterium]|nr:response regulator transcription factor [Xanthomonadaceae bacterium]